jgi:hypothetical protein
MQLFCFGLCDNVGLVGNIWVIYAMIKRKLYSLTTRVDMFEI